MSNNKNKHDIPDISPALVRGPEWLKLLRRDAQAEFNNAPLPRRGLHLWRYTDPDKFLVDHNETTDTAFGEQFDKVEAELKQQVDNGHLSGLVVDLGGREIRTLLRTELEKSGVIVTPLSEAVESHHELVSAHLYTTVNSKSGKFEAMNGALWNDGIFIQVPDNAVVEQPLHLLREAGIAGSAQYPRLLVVVGKNAEITIVDEYGGGAGENDSQPSYSNGVVEIIGKQDSRTRYVSMQRQGSNTNSYLAHRAMIEQGAQMLTIPLAFGASISKQNFGVILNGRNADSNMYGLLFGSGRQHFDNHTLHHHAAGETTSNIDFKVVLRDKANSAYTGLIRIEKESKTCEAYQENRNLLLNQGARAETIPELEILNEDVSCSHGATVGPLDPEMVFYLQSRGYHLDEAVRTIVSGFVANSLRMVPQDLRERITDFVEQRLQGI